MKWWPANAGIGRRLAAGLTTIPAIVRDLDDPEILEIQVIENLLREDLHPLEESEGYGKLCEEHGYRVDDLVLKIGKSRGPTSTLE